MILVLLVCCAQSASPTQTPATIPAAIPAAVEPESSQPAVEPYFGSLRSGRIELARLSNADEHETASRLAARLLAKPDFDLASESERAETLYAIGVVHGRQSSISQAVEAFHRARGLAGSSELGRDAAYNAGTYLLLGAEELRQQIPEIREKLGLPALPAGSAPQRPAPSSGQPPGQPPGHGTNATEPPDTLKLAREAYLAARSALVEAWRADPSFDDCRANLELLQRRLRELAELEEQREQEQEEQSKQDQKDQKPGEEDKQDPSESKPEDQEQDQKSKDDAQKDPEEQKEPEEPQPEEKPEEKDEPPQPQESQPDDAREEMLMTPEEMQRLLDQLQRIDEQAEKVQALLRERRRAPVKKDW